MVHGPIHIKRGILSLGGGCWPGHEVDHSPTCSAEVKNEWQNTYADSYAFMVFKGTTLFFCETAWNLAGTCVIIYNS